MSTFDSLDNTFDIVPTEVTTEIKKAKPLKVGDRVEDREKDYQYARAQLYNIVDKMQEALDGALDVAQSTDHPRAYEVALAGAKNAAEVVEKLQDLHKKTKDMEVEESKIQATQNNTQNNIYMTGSTSDLMRMLKENQKELDK